jgi:cytochrome P450
MELLWTLIGFLLTLLTYYIFKYYDEAASYKKKGIIYMGNGMYKVLHKTIKGLSQTDYSNEQYWKIKNFKKRFAVGSDFSSTTFFIADVTLIRDICIKKFDHFVDRRILITKTEPLVGRMLMALKGDDWKNLRSKLSHAFTTGKVRNMFSRFDNSAKQMINYLQNQLSSSSNGIVDLENAYSKLTMDSIASVAFGIDSKAFDEVEPSTFEQMGKKLPGSLNVSAIIKLITFSISPRLSEYLGFSFMSVEAQAFFADVVKDIIKQREQSGERRNDFLQLMLDAREGKLQIDEGRLDSYEADAMIKLPKKRETNKKTITLELDDDDIVAQSILFIAGGYDTVLSLHLFLAYNLAIHQDVQQKLYEELTTAIGKNDGEITFDLINGLEYLDMFVNGKILVEII